MSVIFEAGYTLPGSDQPLNHARILHSLNWLSGGTAVASTTDSSYFADAPLNSLTYEKWRPTSATATWEYDHGSSAAGVDCCCIAAHNMGTTSGSIKVQYHNGSTWVDLSAVTAIADDSPIMFIFEPVTAQRFRISMTLSSPIAWVGVVKFGTALQMTQAIYGGHSPINLSRQTKLRSNVSETGEFLGRTKIRTQMANSFGWTHLKAAWVRSNVPTLQKAIESEPFWIAWNPGTYGEVGYAQTDSVPIPRNMGIKDFMELTLSVRARGWD